MTRCSSAHDAGLPTLLPPPGAVAEPAAMIGTASEDAVVESLGGRRCSSVGMLDQKLPIPSVHRTAPPIAVGTADADGTESEASSGNR